MVVIGNNIFCFKDDELMLNSYLLISYNNDVCIINPTLNSIKKMFIRFEFNNEDQINILYTENDYIEYNNVIDFLVENNQKTTIYFENIKDYKNNNNIDFKQFETRNEIGEFVFFKLETPGYTKNSICLKIKEMLFTGNSLINDKNYYGVYDKKLFLKSIDYLKQEIPGHFLICSSVGESIKLYLLLKNISLIKIN